MKYTRIASLTLLVLLLSPPTLAQPSMILLQNVYVFDGQSDKRSNSQQSVLIHNNLIHTISNSPITPPEDTDTDVTIIDGAGHTLIPGLIDAHWHSMMVQASMPETLMADVGYLNLIAAKVSEATLMRGFTSVRDMGGPSFGLRRAIDQGLVSGPRIFPSGAMISQTGGHGDFRLPNEIPRASNEPLNHSDKIGATAIADGVPEVLRRTREQLMLGATQIKLMAGGGVSSFYDPIDVSQYTLEEMRAAVQAAENWGTYVSVHAYTPRAIRMAIEAGVKCIEHGQLIDESTARLMAKKGVWWSLQPFLDNELANPQTGDARQKQLLVSAGTDRAYALAKKHNINVAFGSDLLFSGKLGAKQGPLLASLQRWYSPGEILKMATGDNARLLALSGPRYPYSAPVGVIAPGALADLLLVKGDPSRDISLLVNTDEHLLVIIKDGYIHKNLLAQ